MFKKGSQDNVARKEPSKEYTLFIWIYDCFEINVVMQLRQQWVLVCFCGCFCLHDIVRAEDSEEIDRRG